MDTALEQQIARRERAIAVVKQILVEDLHLPMQAGAIDVDAALFGTGLGLDSVDAIELVIAAEQRFGVSLPQEALRGALRSVNTLVDMVLALQRDGGEP